MDRADDTADDAPGVPLPEDFPFSQTITRVNAESRRRENLWTYVGRYIAVAAVYLRWLAVLN